MKTTRRLAGFFVTLAFCTSNCSAQTFSTSTASSTITSTTQARSSGTSTNPQITTGPTVATSACSWLSSYISSCISRLPGFLSAPEPTQRSCLCTQSTLIGNYSSALFDAEVSICANYVSTANPSDYGRWSDLVGFCTSPGPIVTSTFSTITSAAPTSSSAAGTTPVTVPTTSATTGINQPGGSGNLGPIQSEPLPH
ncbi:hypothetical protein B0J14DRAFT_336229 [Halenospora varia]|nr:hypothetical protein B0J14DRAFT_336229 [Halenospora varia]